MQLLINLIKAELFKLKRNDTFWVLIAVVTAVYGLANYLVIIDWWQLYDTGFYSVGLEEYNAMESMKVPFFFNLIISTLAGFFINTDYTTGTIKNQVLSGNKRSHIYLAKLIVFSIGAVIIAVIVPIVTIICETFLLGYSEIYTTPAVAYLLRSFSLYALIIISYSAIIILIASVTGESGKTIIITIVLTLILEIIKILFVSKYIIVSFIYENSIFYQIYQAFSPTITTNELAKNIFITISTFSIMVYCGILIFQRREIK